MALPWTIVSGGPTHTAIVTHAGGRERPIYTGGQAAKLARLHAVWGLEKPESDGPACMSVIRAAGGIGSPVVMTDAMPENYPRPVLRGSLLKFKLQLQASGHAFTHASIALHAKVYGKTAILDRAQSQAQFAHAGIALGGWRADVHAVDG